MTPLPEIIQGRVLSRKACEEWLAERGLRVTTMMNPGRAGDKYWASDERGLVGPILSTGRLYSKRLIADDYRRLVAILAEAERKEGQAR